MKLLLAFVLALLTVVNAGIIPTNPITTTYVGATAPVATSYQVVSRNVNRVFVPHVPAVTTTSLGYPGYAGSWAGYPYGYRYGYTGYGYPHTYGYSYGYPYGYGATIW